MIVFEIQQFVKIYLNTGRYKKTQDKKIENISRNYFHSNKSSGKIIKFPENWGRTDLLLTQLTFEN